MNERASLILIVEDDEELARLNTRLLKRQGYNVIAANNAAEAHMLFLENTPDLFVLDIELPDGDGFSLCSELRQITDAPVLFLTGKTETLDKVTGLSAGGDYYLTKPYDRDEFLAVVQSLLRRVEKTREKLTEVSVITNGCFSLKLNEGKAYVNGRNAELSQKEFAVLLLLVQNEGKEVSYEQLYESVWGTAMYNDSTALRQQISRLKKKLDEANSDDFDIFNEKGRGYTLNIYR